MGYMNQFFFSWKGGNLYRHNSELVNRNTFYNQYTPSSVDSVFNERPIEKKVFKTAALESTDSWDFSCVTDLEDGNINKSFFEKKEGTFFSYIRGIQTVPALLSDYDLRSAQGVGVITQINSSVASAVVITFSVSPDRMISVGDHVYSKNTPVLSGIITGINTQNNTITIDSTISGTTLPSIGDFVMVVKNNIAESNGVRGDFMNFRIVNDKLTRTEIFAIKSEVFKSFP
jgi:hypothetical protein